MVSGWALGLVDTVPPFLQQNYPSLSPFLLAVNGLHLG